MKSVEAERSRPCQHIHTMTVPCMPSCQPILQLLSTINHYANFTDARSGGPVLFCITANQVHITTHVPMTDIASIM